MFAIAHPKNPKLPSSQQDVSHVNTMKLMNEYEETGRPIFKRRPCKSAEAVESVVARQHLQTTNEQHPAHGMYLLYDGK